MNKNGHNGKKEKQTQTHGEGDWIHIVIGHMEHLMDLFEIALAFIVAFGFVVSVIPLLKEMPHLMSHSSGTAEFHEFLENEDLEVDSAKMERICRLHGLNSRDELMIALGQKKIILEEAWADPNSPVTHAIMWFASGSSGAFIGALDNVLWVDEVRLEY